MPKISVDPDDFANIVFSYLLDKYLNFEEVSNENEEFNEAMLRLRSKLFPVARKMYLEQDADLRLKYKLIKDAFRGDSSINSIFIVPRGKTKPEDPGVIAKLIKKVVKAITGSREFSTEEVEFLREQLGDKEDDMDTTEV